MKPRTAIIVNAVVFQVVWVIAVGGTARGMWYAGPIAVAMFALWQLTTAAQPMTDVVLIALALALGLIADSVLAATGLVVYAAPFPSTHFAPLWILALWANFALSLNHSLAWLQSKLLLACVFGAVGGPLSYFFAARTWHAVTLGEPLWMPLAVIAATWAVVTPLLCLAAARVARSPRAPLSAINELPS